MQVVIRVHVVLVWVVWVAWEAWVDWATWGHYSKIQNSFKLFRYDYKCFRHASCVGELNKKIYYIVHNVSMKPTESEGE